MSYLQKTKKDGKVNLEKLVFRLQKGYDEKTFNLLVQALNRILYAYLNGWDLFDRNDIKDIIQSYFCIGLSKSIYSYRPGFIPFKYYVSRIVKLRAITEYHNQEKTFTYERNDDLNCDYGIAKIHVHMRKYGEDRWVKYDQDYINHTAKKSQEYFEFLDEIKRVLNCIPKIENDDYRRVLYFYLIFSFKRNYYLENLVGVLYFRDVKAVQTHYYRAKKELSKITGRNIETQIIKEIRKYIYLKNKNIQELIFIVEQCKDMYNFTDITIEDKLELTRFMNNLVEKNNIDKIFQIGE
jgi:hypothetical protein